MSSSLMPSSGGSLMPSSTVPTQATPSGGFVDDLFFSADDSKYVGYDGDNSVNGRPREIRFTRRLASEYAHGIGVTPAETNGIILRNSSPALVGAQQYSPSIFLAGQGWKTNSTAGSQEVIFRLETQPVQGAANPTGNLAFASSINGAAYTSLMTLSDTGVLTLNAAAGGLIATQVIAGASSNVYLRGGTSIASTGINANAIDVVQSTVAANTFVFLNAARTDAASNIVIASCYDRNAASITNAATMRLHSFGWTNNSDAYTELAAVYADGTIESSSARAIGTGTGTFGLHVGNTTAAAAGAQQNSPVIKLTGQGWKTNSTAGSQAVYFQEQVRPVQGAAAPTGNLWWSSSVNNAAIVDLMNLSDTGALSLPSITGGLSISAAKALGTAPTEATGLVLRNSTPAQLNTQQYSPGLYLSGRCWETTGGSSQDVTWRMDVRPIQGATASGWLRFQASVNGAAYGSSIVFYGAGHVVLPVGGVLYANDCGPNTDGAGSLGSAFTRYARVNVQDSVNVYTPSNGAICSIKQLTEETTIAAAATTDTAIQIPAGAVVLGVTVRVTTVIPTATSFDVGIAGDTQRFAAALAVAAGTTDKGCPDAWDKYAAATAVRLTMQGGTPADNTGRVRVTIYYTDVTPATS